MAEIGLRKWRFMRCITMVVISIVTASSMLASADRSVMKEDLAAVGVADFDGHLGSGYFEKLANYLFQTDGTGYQHVWPEFKFGWKIVVGTFFGFCGAAFGSVGGIGGGGVFVPMLTLIIGFDPKSATALSKCMIMGASASAVYYNLKLRHPTLDMPIIDYDLAVLIQPMLMLGISIGVSFNVIFADWMVTVLLITLCIGTSTRAFFRGVDTWKKETIIKQEAAKRLKPNGEDEVDYKFLPGGPSNETKANDLLKQEYTVLESVCWKELGLLVIVWIAFLTLQIAKTYTSTCSIAYWALDMLQVPVSFGVSGYEAISLYNGSRKISSRVNSDTDLRVGQLILYCSCGVLAGMVGGLLGIGGGSILGTLFLELGIPPQVSSATAIFAMMFSSSMSVVEYYLLKRFPIPYALYFIVVATIAAFTGQHIVRRIVIIMGRASIIVFILAFTVFVSAITLGGVGISNMINKIQQHEYMGFENLCKYEV